MTERFMVDDAGTLIDMQTRDMFDIVEEVCPLLNEQHEQIQHLESRIKDYDVALKSLQDLTDRKLKENEQLRTALKELREIGDYQADRIQELNDENEQLKEVLGSILIEVRRDISATNQSGEVKAFVTPNSFDLIVDILKKYGALKDWYE